MYALPSVGPSVSNAFVKWFETGIHGGSRACKGEDASIDRSFTLTWFFYYFEVLLLT